MTLERGENGSIKSVDSSIVSTFFLVKGGKLSAERECLRP